MSKTKILFNIINTTFIILYVYPGSILGFLIYGELNKQPQLTSDFFFNIFKSCICVFSIVFIRLDCILQK